MVQILGTGIGLDELSYIGLAIILVSTIGNLILFQEIEGAIPVLDKRVIGFPECKIDITLPNIDYTVLSFCIAPSFKEISSLSNTITFQNFRIDETDEINKAKNLASIVFVPISVIILIIKLFLSFELALGIAKIIGAIFSFLNDVGLF